MLLGEKRVRFAEQILVDAAGQDIKARIASFQLLRLDDLACSADGSPCAHLGRAGFGARGEVSHGHSFARQDSRAIVPDSRMLVRSTRVISLAFALCVLGQLLPIRVSYAVVAALLAALALPVRLLLALVELLLSFQEGRERDRGEFCVRAGRVSK